MSDDIKVICPPSASNPFLVIYKNAGLPSAPITEDDKHNALSKLISLYPEITNVHGRKTIEYGLLHRIDTVTSGLLLIATTQASYDYLLDAQKQGLFHKKYRSECEKTLVKKEGFPDISLNDFLVNKNTYSVKSFFRPFGKGSKEVRPVIVDDSKTSKYVLKKATNTIYTTEVSLLSKDDRIFAECRINNGYRHQVRCHLAWIGFPIIGDALYNPNCNDKKMDFEAYEIEFPHPITHKMIKICPQGDLNSHELTFTST